MNYFIKTFGCQANYADSERIAAAFEARGYTEAQGYDDADIVVINTCIVRQSAEDRVYGLIKNLAAKKEQNKNFKIVVTGCLVGAAHREPSGQRLKDLRRLLPDVDEFLPIEEVGWEHMPVRTDKQHALVPISNGCNNMCAYCIVPFSRGYEVSRPFDDIVHEAEHLVQQGYIEVTLLGQNVNSYGADLVAQGEGKQVEPVMVKHLGKYRIPTLFPHLLERVAQLPFKKVSFISSNPWDFSDELIRVIAKYKNINREIHLPVQSGDNDILKRMNRWYTREEYLELIKKIKTQIPEAEFTTDIIVGFPGETEVKFENTADLCRQVKFNIAYISRYSPRKGTVAESKLTNDISHVEKKRRWRVLNELVNKKA
jgi:tRNA-2-methylthio-N6-dimethylallyladenosine synthase